MREGEYPIYQYHPIAINITINNINLKVQQTAGQFEKLSILSPEDKKRLDKYAKHDKKT